MTVTGKGGNRLVAADLDEFNQKYALDGPFRSKCVPLRRIDPGERLPQVMG